MSGKEFLSLEMNDQLKDILKSLLIKIEKENCGGHGTYPTHNVSFEENGVQVKDSIYHDGQSIRYLSDGEKIKKIVKVI